MSWYDGIWNICVPRDKVHKLVDELDIDGDGYISLKEIKKLLKSYAKAVKRDKRY